MAVVGTRAHQSGGVVGRLGVFVWRAGGRDAALVGALCALQVTVIAAAYWCYKLNEGPDVFVGAIGGDEGLTLSLLKASVFRFENPWSLPSESDRAAFLVPGLGSVWLYAPIGYLSALMRVDPWVAHRLLIVAGIVASVVSAYCVFKRVLGPGLLVRIALVLFVCSSGAGGLVYLAGVLGRAAPFPPAPPFFGVVGIVTYEFFEGAALTPITQAFRSYYTIPMAMANVGLWSLHKTLTQASIRGHVVTGASLALAVLWYPMIGLWYIAMALVWIVLEVARGLSGPRGLAPAGAIRPTVASLTGLAGLLPYLRSDIARSAMTAQYVGSRIAAVPQALFVGIALLLPFALLHVLRRTRDRILTAALALWAFSYVLAPPGHGTGLLPRLLRVPVHAWLASLRWAGWMLLGVACVRATRAWSLALRRQPRDAVLLIWLVLAMILAVQQPFRALPALFPARMMLVVWLPLSACAAMGMRSTAAWRGVDLPGHRHVPADSHR